MTAVGQRLKVRLFLEGVEVPCISAVIQSQPNQAAVASIAIPANDYALDFRPRTLVHVFVYDTYRGTPPEQQVYVGGAGITSKPVRDPDAGSPIPEADAVSSPEQDFIDLENENFKLAFGGEVVGIQYSKQPTSRAIVLQCVDWSSYWDIAYQYMIGGFSLGGGGIKAAFSGASTTVFNDFLEGSGDIVLKLMETAPRSYPSLKGTLLGAIVHIMEAMGGVYFGDRAVRGVNDFFSLAEMRLHLTQMLGANPFSIGDEQRLMRANGFGSLFSKALGGLGKLVTIRQIFQALQRYIFHEVVPITSPRYIPPAVDPNTAQFETVPLSADRDTAAIAKTAQTIKTRVLEIKARQERATDAAAAQVQSQKRGGLQKELLGLVETAAEAQKKARKVGVQNGTWNPFGDLMGLSEVSRVFEAATRQFVAVLGAARKGTTGLYEFPLQGSSQAASILQILEDVSAAMQRVLEAKSRRRVQRSTSQPDPPARLLTQIYRPDVWMVAPPRCNVIFPEAYSQFSYGRNFQQEVTRMLLRTSSAFFGSDILFDGFYMAPSRLLGARTGKNIAKGRIGVEPADMADTPAWVVKDMMDHELFTGIIPSFERMTDLNLHAIRGGSIEINGAKVGYAQLACNHIFFQHRFKSRELMMSGRFNPYLTLGFPAVIVDKYLNDDQLRNGEYDTAVAVRLADQFKQANTPLPSQQRQEIVEANQAGVDEVLALTAPRGSNHYLGTSSLIVHSLTATGGGTTQVQMTYARSTDERTEFLGDNVGTSSKAKRIKNVKVPTVVAAFEPPTVGAKGYMGGQILEARDVTDQYQKKQTPKKGRTALGAERFASSTQLPLFVQGKAAGRVRRGTRVPVGVEMAASAYGPEVVALVGSGGGTAAGANEALVTFRAFRIVEEVGSYARTEVELPPEDLTFPPWYGESYRTNQIGGLYSYYFGVGAITDPTVILGTTSPKTFGDGDSARTLYLQFENSMARVTQNALQSVSQPGQRPTPGSTGAPGVAGGGDIGPAGTSNPETDSVLGQIGARSPIAVAIEELVKAYSATRSQQFDTPQFVQNYTWRPIASMVDIFGTSNLVIDDNGFVQSGREGFHSRAFGAYDDLRQLVNQTGGAGPQKILGLAAGTKELSTDEDDPEARVSARLDTRKEKQAAVMKYLYAIASARGVVLG